MSEQGATYEDHTVTVRGGDGIISQEDFVAYWDVMMSAFAVHIDREEIRQGLWKEYPAEDQFHQIKVKIDRVGRSMEQILALAKTLGESTPDETQHQETQSRINALGANVREEVYDIINYANFGERQL